MMGTALDVLSADPDLSFFGGQMVAGMAAGPRASSAGF
jgi:hypothetical protein